MTTWLQVDNNEGFAAVNIERVEFAQVKGKSLILWLKNRKKSFEIIYKTEEKAKEGYNMIIKGAT